MKKITINLLPHLLYLPYIHFRRKLRPFLALTFFLISQLFFNVSVCAQTADSKITFGMQNQTLEYGLNELGRITKLRVAFAIPQVSKYTNISIDKKARTLAETLNLLLANTDLTYKVNANNNLVIFEKTSSGQPEPAKNNRVGTLTGKVVNSNNEPLPGVSVYIKGVNGKGTVTDSNGAYAINLSGNESVIVFSQIGLKKQEVNIDGRSLLNVKMEEDNITLNQVVVTGIFTKKASSFTGSAVTVTSKELQINGNRNLVTSLRNIDPSFNIIESNSFGTDPNRLPEIQIRGNSSVPNISELKGETRVGLNTPLVVIDGFESSLQSMIDMNENEVESITILKDASATSMYGSRGANGVVVIKTKAPKAGKLLLSLSSRLNIENPDLTGYNLLNAKDKLNLEYKVGIYNNVRAESDLPLKRYYNYLLNEVNSGVNTDWLSLPLRSGVGQRHNLRLEGGDEHFRYSASAQINNTVGVMKGSFRNNFNGTISLAYYYSNLKFTNQLIVGLTNNENSPYGSFSDYSKMNPYWRPYDNNGVVNKFLGDPGSTDYSGVWSNLPTNPLYNASLNTFDKGNNTSVRNNFSIEWMLIPDLTMRAQLGLTKGINQNDRFRPAEHTAFANYSGADLLRKGDYLYGIGNTFSYDGSLNLNYSKTFAEKHALYLGLDYNIRQSESSNYGFLVEGFTNSNFDFPSMALQYAQNSKPSGSESLTRSVGLTANVNYTYDNRYYVDASLREDGSSQFGSQKRFAPFWSAGLGWNLHNEAFLKDSKIINRLKIRGSAGVTGSLNFPAYQSLSTYQYYTDNRYYTWMGAYLLGLGNDQLKWQQKSNYDIGLEAQMFNQRILLTFDYYTGTTKDVVSSIDLSPSNGFSSYVENIGEMKNTGFESKITAYLYRNPSKDISWNISAAIFQNKNKVIKISKAMYDTQQGILNSGGAIPTTLYMEGYSSNTIWVVPSLGIDPSTGKEMFLDKNGEPTYTWNSQNVRACGTTDPDFQGNFGSMFRYKGITLNVTFRYQYGGQAYNQTLINKVENADYKYNVDARVYTGRWQYPGDQAFFKSLNVTTATQMTSRFVQDANTLTCQDINLQYDFKSPKLTKLTGISVLTLSASMDDLFYLSTIKRERGTDYPFSRNLSFGVSAIF